MTIKSENLPPVPGGVKISRMNSTRIIFFSLAVLCIALFLHFPASCEDENITTDWTSQDVCRNMCFPRTNQGLFSCYQECNRNDEVRLPGGIDFLVKKMRENMFPPVIDNIVTVPEQPKAGADFAIKLSPRKQKLEILESYKVKLFYSFIRPFDWKNTSFDFDSEERTWSASMHIPDSEKEIYYLVRAGDDDGNTYIDLPCETTSPGIGSEDCFFPLSKDDTYEGLEDFSVSPALDITESFIAADSRRYYFRIKTLADIDPGKSMPPTYNYYLIGIFDPGRPTDVDPYHKTIFILYSPYFYPGVTCSRNMSNSSWEMPEETPVCITRPCAAIVRLGATWAYDTGSVTCEAKGNELFLSIQRKMFEPTSYGVFVAYTATGIILDMESSIITDYTPSAAVYPRLAPVAVLSGD